MKKAIAVVLALLLLLGSFAVPHTARADSFDITSVYEPYFIVVDADHPTVALNGLERDADLKVEPASTTKILTCIVAIEETQKNGRSLDDMVTVSAKAVDFGRGNSLMGLEEGDTFSLIDLLYGMMLPSGNDAAIAIAEHVAGSTKDFAKLMNAKASEIGMHASHFVTVHGKHDSNHYTTVRDMALLTAYALQNETFCEIVSTGRYTATSGPRELTVLNSNRMLIDMEPTEKLQNPISCLYPNAIGVKTGDTTQAGKCLIAAARKEGVTLIAVLFGGTLNDSTYDSGASDNRKDKYNAYRFQDAAKLFDYVYGTMECTVTIDELKAAGLETTFPITVPNAIDSDPEGGVLTVRANIADSFTMNLMEPKLKAILEEAATLDDVSITNSYAPISEGSVIGRVSYNYRGETLFSADLIATRSVREGMAQVSVGTPEAPDPQGTASVDQPENHSVGLIAEVSQSGKPVGEQDEQDVMQCGSMQLKPQQVVLMILLPVILLLLIGCLAMFAVYLHRERVRREKKRKKALARKRARQREQQNRY